MKFGTVRTILIVSVFSLLFGIQAMAASVDIPYEIEFDIDECPRLCYAGHGQGNVRYKKGIAVTPDAMFQIVPKDTAGVSSGDGTDVGVSVSVIYENESSTGSYREPVIQYVAGSLDIDESYSLFSENTLESLSDRDLLYSDSLKGFELTLSYKNGGRSAKRRVYLYVCPDDAFFDYLESGVYEDGDTSDGQDYTVVGVK